MSVVGVLNGAKSFTRFLNVVLSSNRDYYNNRRCNPLYSLKKVPSC